MGCFGFFWLVGFIWLFFWTQYLILIMCFFQVVDIYDHVNRSQVRMIPSRGPVAQILPVEGEEDAVVDQLTNVPHISVYHKRDIPDRLHYKHNRRIMPVVVIADEGWLVTDVSITLY